MVKPGAHHAVDWITIRSPSTGSLQGKQTEVTATEELYI